ncbi:MAG: ABC transporter ATP-binding protein [Betaproteobacteria bacterium]|nr:ABC transporter ATP-binding protein [Betaproteobacteria bacterium]
MNVIETRALSIGYGRKTVMESLAFNVKAGEVLCLLGPNGGGKTTLFKTLLGLLPPLSGEVRVLGETITGWSRLAFAQRVAYMPQAHAGIFPFTVNEIVLMGRTARIGRFAIPSKHDHKIAADCLEMLGIAHLGECIYTAISGGERQLALIARALAQQPAVLVMDEPTASLDFGNQIRILGHIDRLRDQGITILMSTHQPEHALRVADRIALLAPGSIAGIGAPQDIATPDKLAALYSVTEDEITAYLPARTQLN